MILVAVGAAMVLVAVGLGSGAMARALYRRGYELLPIPVAGVAAVSFIMAGFLTAYVIDTGI